MEKTEEALKEMRKNQRRELGNVEIRRWIGMRRWSNGGVSGHRNGGFRRRSRVCIVLRKKEERK